MEIYPERLERFQSVIRKRQYDFTVILENVHDPHNIGAVLRTCDTVGINEIFVIYTDDRLSRQGLEIGLKSASGAKQWIKVNYFEDVDECFKEVRKRFDSVYATKLDEGAKNLYDLDLASSVALLFGNEHKGLTEDAMKYVDGNFIIPQHGFVQSLNISVACAVTLYEAQRQRLINGKYDRVFGEDERDHDLFEKYQQIHIDKKLVKVKRGKYIR